MTAPALVRALLMFTQKATRVTSPPANKEKSRPMRRNRGLLEDGVLELAVGAAVRV